MQNPGFLPNKTGSGCDTFDSGEATLELGATTVDFGAKTTDCGESRVTLMETQLQNLHDLMVCMIPCARSLAHVARSGGVLRLVGSSNRHLLAELLPRDLNSESRAADCATP